MDIDMLEKQCIFYRYILWLLNIFPRESWTPQYTYSMSADEREKGMKGSGPAYLGNRLSQE